MKQNKILVIDDDKDLCMLIERELQQENFKVTVCNDGKTGLDTFLSNTFQIIILDVMLPTLNGFDILSRIRNDSNVPVLMLTAKGSEVDKVSGLRLGADDYLTKPFLMSEFIARVQSIIRRYTVLNVGKNDDCILTFDGMKIDTSIRTVTVNDMPVQLTAKEFDLLYFLASNQGKVFTKEQIYIHVWNEEYSFDDRNIMSFISKLRKKINNGSLEMEYIQTIHSIGYRFNLEV